MKHTNLNDNMFRRKVVQRKRVHGSEKECVYAFDWFNLFIVNYFAKNGHKKMRLCENMNDVCAYAV